MCNPKIMIVDDDKNVLRVLTVSLSRSGFDIISCNNGFEALNILENDNEINTVITDLSMKKMSGQELFQKINEDYPYIPVIILTGYGSVESAVELVKKGAFSYLEKPSDNNQLVKILHSAIKHNSLHRKFQILKQEVDENRTFCNIVGESRKMLEIFELINVVAPSDITILIEGESGTGKELVAKAIHAKSHRSNNIFVPINCGAIPPTLMESELFGHEMGAFTGAVKQRKGKFEVANKGTIFLDEIGELDLSLQAKLLRILEEKTLQRVGSNKDILTDFRLIAATNRNLKEEVKKGKFRKDLYYRLNEIEIQVPPLKKRKEDIIVLTRFFLDKYSVLHNKKVKEISPSVLNLLFNYNWPGNVRELENVIKRATVLCSGNKIRKKDMHPDVVSYNIKSLNTKTDDEVGDKMEKKKVIDALKKTKGNKTKAAAILSIERTKLYRLLEKYSIGI